MKTLSIIILSIVCLTGAPLLGVHLAGEPAGEYLEFPPATTSLTIQHAPFSWTAFFIIMALIVMVMAPFIRRVVVSNKETGPEEREQREFPWWGWAGLIIMVAGWILAWTRFDWLKEWQTHTFTLPWAGYIILVNALTLKRGGRSLITHEPGYLLILFLFSAMFWWYFEFLNQFVQNWYYVNVDAGDRLGFFIYATLPFSTVLPAVISTFLLLKTFPRSSSGLDNFYAVRINDPESVGLVGGLAGVTGLILTGVWPGYFFPMLWLAPLLIMAGAMLLNGERRLLKDLSAGNWQTIYLLALSALICGFFWEMWNYYSLSRWEYSVPLVNRFHVFEMPLAGYAGYLPFGLQCGLAAWMVKPSR
jgi:hypothetical protein